MHRDFDICFFAFMLAAFEGTHKFDHIASLRSFKSFILTFEHCIITDFVGNSSNIINLFAIDRGNEINIHIVTFFSFAAHIGECRKTLTQVSESFFDVCFFDRSCWHLNRHLCWIWK